MAAFRRGLKEAGRVKDQNARGITVPISHVVRLGNRRLAAFEALSLRVAQVPHALPGLGVRVEPHQCRPRERAGFSAIASSMEMVPAMKSLLNEIRHTPLLWMLIFVPAVLVAETAAPHSHTLLFVLSVLAIVPLAALLSHATRAVRRTHAGVAELCRRTVTDEPAVLAGRRHHGDDCDRDGELHYEQRALGLVRRRPAHLHLRGLCADAVCGSAGWPGDGVKPTPLFLAVSQSAPFTE